MPPSLRAGLALLLAALAVGGAAQPRPLSFRSLTTAQGLGGDLVLAVARDAEGFVWVGTSNGVSRYDGVRVQTWDDAVGQTDRYVRSLGVAPDGAVWAGGDAGLARLAPGAERFAPVPGPATRAMAPTRGALFAGSASGVLRLDARGVRRLGLARDTVRALTALPGGGVVAATSRGLARLAPTGARHGTPRADRGVTALAVVDGALWAGRRAGTLGRLDPETLAPRGPRLDAGAEIAAIEPSEARPGWAYVGTRGGGLLALDPEGRLWPLDSGGALDHADILTVRELDEVLWVGTINGLFFADVTPPRFRSVGAAPGGLAIPDVLSVHASRRTPGMAWVGTIRGGLHRYDLASGTAQRWFEAPTHPLSVTFDIHEAGDVLWLAGLEPTLFRFEPATGALRAIPLAADGDGVTRDIVPSAARPGHAWVVTSEAGTHLVDLNAEAVVDAGPAVRALGATWTVAEDPWVRGTLLAATEEAGLRRLAIGGARSQRVGDCTAGPVVSVVPTATAVWAGGEPGWLARVDRATGACRLWTDADGLPGGGVGGLFPEGDHLWLSTNGGLARFDPAANVFTTFSETDGLPPGALYYHARDRSPDGRIWIGGAGGFTAFAPRAIPVDAEPARVRLTRVLVDGEPVPLADAADGLVLPYNRNDLAVEYAALDLRQPEKNRYRVRLGPDGEWEPAAAQIRYPLLPVGRYTLEVAASNRDGYWGEPAALAVRVRPPFWRALWFWAVVGLAAGGAAFGAHRYRVDQLLRVERTRRRIADDLHDDIGSKISSVALRLDALRRSPHLPPEEQARVGRLGATTRAVVSDLRDTVWLVDAGHDDLASLADRIEQFANQTLGGGAVTRGAIPTVPLPMGPRRDLYFLFTEALHNAVRHADAEHVTVEVACDDDAFSVAVEDDGRGFEAAIGDGRGMTTMRRRADALGGTLAVDSAPGRGTRVTFRLPLTSRVLRRGAETR
ncbi:ATP-binding protein [Rubrivirga sp. IMCC45206]|uniref:sensor histidine kinase n=1 Tax=Rubrivirga sp. IMCC45206 TaxID=3391614 RepID=UPI0039900C6D